MRAHRMRSGLSCFPSSGRFGESLLLPVSVVHFFLSLIGIPLCAYTSLCLPIHLRPPVLGFYSGSSLCKGVFSLFQFTFLYSFVDSLKV